MYKQISIFDFIDKPLELQYETQFESMFTKIKNPVIQCANCLCDRCVNNVEELWNKVQPEEQRLPCFNCDECYIYTGDSKHKVNRREDCKEFEISEYAAKSVRKKIKIVK